MASGQFFPAIQAARGFAVTPSDTLNIKADPNNTQNQKATFVYLHCTAASGLVRVLLAGMSDTDTPVQIYLTQGAVNPMAVKRVFLTSPAPPATIVGVY